MDPLSIAAASTGLVSLCVKVSSFLYTFVEDTRTVDAQISGLYDEIISLSNVLEAISRSWTKNARIASAQADNEPQLWNSVNASLEDCKITLLKLDKTLSDVQSKTFLERGVLKQPVMTVKLNLKMKDITYYRQQLHSYGNAMQSALLMINLCLHMSNNSSHESMVHELSGLRSQLGRVERAIEVQNQYSAGESSNEDVRATSNLRRLVRAAESFYSSASTVIEGTRSTVWGGSIMGDPLSEDQASKISDWIPPPSIPEEGSDLMGPFADVAAGTKDTTEVDDAFVFDSEIERDLIRNFYDIAFTSFKNGDYAKAETFFRKAIDRSAVGKEKQLDDNDKMKLALAYSCGLQNKWDDMESIIVPLAAGAVNGDIMTVHALHTLAIVRHERKDYDTAIRYCKRAIVNKRKIMGKDHDSSHDSMALLAHIYEAKGDIAEAEGYRRFLPPSHASARNFQPSNYMRAHMVELDIISPAASASVASQNESSRSISLTGEIPPLSLDKREEYAQLFDKSGAQDGILSGEHGKWIFDKSKLSSGTLSRIWDLVDIENKGSLDKAGFIVAMHLIMSLKSGKMADLPTILPPKLLQFAAENTQTPYEFTKADAWIITPDLKAEYDRLFDELDVSCQGFIPGKQAVAFFAATRLKTGVLMRIWDLSDIDGDGKLSRDEFAVAMHLAKLQLADGANFKLPDTLPPEFIPSGIPMEARELWRASKLFDS